MSKISLKGVIDMHVHSNPDLRKRAYDDIELMEAGIRVGARAIVIKTHRGRPWTGLTSATATMRLFTAAATHLPCSGALP